MTSPIEYNNQPVKLSAYTRAAYFVDGDMLFKVPPGSLISVCAWCSKHSPAVLELDNQGFKISHGICQACHARQLAELASNEG